jgi:hypothetical protein
MFGIFRMHVRQVAAERLAHGVVAQAGAAKG